MAVTHTESSEPERQVGYFERRPVEDINHAIERAQEKIDILQMDLSSIKRHHLDSLIRALKGNHRLGVRILTLEPDGAFAAIRAAQLQGVRLGEYKDGLHRHIREVMGALSEFPRVKLRIYDEYPPQITFRIDDIVYVCTIAKDYRSRELCTFKLRIDDAGVEKSFVSQFDGIWEKIAREHP